MEQWLAIKPSLATLLHSLEAWDRTVVKEAEFEQLAWLWAMEEVANVAPEPAVPANATERADTVVKESTELNATTGQPGSIKLRNIARGIFAEAAATAWDLVSRTPKELYAETLVREEDAWDRMVEASVHSHPRTDTERINKLLTFVSEDVQKKYRRAIYRQKEYTDT